MPIVFPCRADLTPRASRIHAFLDRTSLPTPLLVMDVQAVLQQYRELQGALPGARIYYAVKANPMPEILRALEREGARFDVASAAEIETCLSLGITPDRLSFGHTVKKASAIALAHSAGLDLFTCDSPAELAKIARHAPGARVVVRLLTDGSGADWPLSRKFGCGPAMARDLLVDARRRGLVPYGLSFHVGSQQTRPCGWDRPIAVSAELFDDLRRHGIHLHALNLGGGFPADYTTPVAPIDQYGAQIQQSLVQAFGSDLPDVIAEPGRYLVASAGVILSEVILIATRS